MPTDYMTTGKAAKLLGVSRQYILRLIKTGDIPAEEIDMGDRTFHRIALADLKEFQRKREAKILNAPINDTRRSPSVDPKAVA